LVEGATQTSARRTQAAVTGARATGWVGGASWEGAEGGAKGGEEARGVESAGESGGAVGPTLVLVDGEVGGEGDEGTEDESRRGHGGGAMRAQGDDDAHACGTVLGCESGAEVRVEGATETGARRVQAADTGAHAADRVGGAGEEGAGVGGGRGVEERETRTAGVGVATAEGGCPMVSTVRARRLRDAAAEGDDDDVLRGEDGEARPASADGAAHTGRTVSGCESGAEVRVEGATETGARRVQAADTGAHATVDGAGGEGTETRGEAEGSEGGRRGAAVVRGGGIDLATAAQLRTTTRGGSCGRVSSAEVGHGRRGEEVLEGGGEADAGEGEMEGEEEVPAGWQACSQRGRESRWVVAQGSCSIHGAAAAARGARAG
jgi:hypothetical protein